MFSSSTLLYSLSLFLSLSLLFLLLSSSRNNNNLLSPADELDDLSLFHRAALSSPRRLISLSPPPKIAFLFLTNSDLTFLPLWERFFQGHQHLYNAYIHSDPSSTTSLSSSSTNANFKLIPSKKTARASPSLISAERRLIARAILDDPNNLYFALVSQHCIPLHSFTYIHNRLFKSPPHHHKRSFIEILSDEPFLAKRYAARGDDAMMPEIPFEDFRVGSQFFVLAKRHALTVIRERKMWRKFRLPCVVDEESCYPEEHYFPTLLSVEDREGCSGFTLTRVDWTGSVDGHPRTYGAEEVSGEMIRRLRRSNSSLDYFFARKFSPESLEGLMEIADDVIFRD
ncbi:unnamed protein product [Eruca vesicaria subsp. sativa]|uniref:Core-2/I-branching beta-1,6-N-acetylglucosaminyltransferase family protein n=1 Tax=Eruca vesicaria subsp. sativa TaxID=29727 RepID=A0ABC8J0W7_ERUVS|nr:unnamed protein product [Eruca vesicaria subsp. sativa]